MTTSTLLLTPIRGFGSYNWTSFEDLEKQYQIQSTRLQRVRNQDGPTQLLRQCDDLIKKMAVQALDDSHKQEQLKLYELQLATFKQHFQTNVSTTTTTKTTTFSFPHTSVQVAEENYDCSRTSVRYGNVEKLSTHLQVNPLKQFSEDTLFTPTTTNDDEQYGAAKSEATVEPTALPPKESLPKELEVETVEDLDIWD